MAAVITAVPGRLRGGAARTKQTQTHPIFGGSWIRGGPRTRSRSERIGKQTSGLAFTFPAFSLWEIRGAAI